MRGPALGELVKLFQPNGRLKFSASVTYRSVMIIRLRTNLQGAGSNAPIKEVLEAHFAGLRRRARQRELRERPSFITTNLPL